MLRTRRINQLDRWAAAALVNAQHELAFRKRRVRDEGGDPELDLVAGWRHDIDRWACHVERKQRIAAMVPPLAREVEAKILGKIGRRRGVNDRAFGVLAR